MSLWYRFNTQQEYNYKMDSDAPALTWMTSPSQTWACCDLDLWPPVSNQAISRN